MKKNTALGLIALFSSAVSAGTPEIVAAPSSSSYVFATLEGTYSWQKHHNFSFSIFDDSDLLDLHTGRDRSRWGGRFALGIARPIFCDQFHLSGEIGWGYYGRTRHPIIASGLFNEATDIDNVHIKTSQNGFDVLAGLIYSQDCFEVFFKAGALIQNYRRDLHIDFSTISDSLSSYSTKENRTEALPEIKLGASYYFCKDWAITASWMHAFGSRPETRFTFDVENDVTNYIYNDRNPSLDVFTIGLQYRFC